MVIIHIYLFNLTNNYLFYCILETFLLAFDTGIIYPRKSLFGKIKAYHLKVEAKDNGEQPLSDFADVFIQITNSNLHKPSFVDPPIENFTLEVIRVIKF